MSTTTAVLRAAVTEESWIAANDVERCPRWSLRCGARRPTVWRWEGGVKIRAAPRSRHPARQASPIGPMRARAYALHTTLLAAVVWLSRRLWQGVALGLVGGRFLTDLTRGEAVLGTRPNSTVVLHHGCR